jgi:hypothetical protein
MGTDTFTLAVTLSTGSGDPEAGSGPMTLQADSIARAGGDLVFSHDGQEVYRCAVQAFASAHITAGPSGSGDAARWPVPGAWDTQQDRQLLDLHERAVPLEEISRLLQRTHLEIINHLVELGQVPPLERDMQPWTAQEDQQLDTLRGQGKELNEISGLLRRSPANLRRHIAERE